jgi:predicted TIM-barrel fold metal-dependent hydrolase
MIIDWHSHWIPPSLAEQVDRLRELPPAPEFYDVEARLRHMDAHAIERQVISWPTTFGFDALLPVPEVLAFYQEYNRLLGELVARRPDRFSGLAAVPAAEPELAAQELVMGSAALGLIGAVIPADAFLTPTLAARYTSLLAEANRLGSHLYVHPGPTGLAGPGHGPIEFLRVDSSSGRWLLEAGTRLGASAYTLETSGCLDPYPSVTVQVAMLGGHLAWIASTLDERARKNPAGGQSLSPLRHIYVDTGILKTGGQELLVAAREFGADRILYGSDFPQFGAPPTRDACLRSGFDEETIRKIFSGNGRQILRRRK